MQIKRELNKSIKTRRSCKKYLPPFCIFVLGIIIDYLKDFKTNTQRKQFNLENNLFERVWFG